MPVPGERGFVYTEEEKRDLGVFLAHHGDTPRHRYLWRKRKNRDDLGRRRRADRATVRERMSGEYERLDEEFDPKQDAAFLAAAVGALEAQKRREREKRLLDEYMRREAQRNLFFEGVREAIRPIEFPAFRPYEPPAFDAALPRRVVAGVWSDLHAGKRTASFDAAVLASRLDQYLRALWSLAAAQRIEANVDECHMLLLGDLVDGSNIYPTQAWHSEQNVLNQIFRVAAPLLADALRTLATGFGKVVVATVPGNHGRTSKFHHEEDNADNYLYETLRLMTATIPNIEWRIEHSWYQIHRILGTPILLTHGHQHKIAYSVPFYSLTRKALGWHVAMPEPFSVEIIGHFHTANDLLCNDLRLIMNGAFVSDDDFALETLAAKSAPTQTLLVFEEGNGLIERRLVHFAGNGEGAA